MPFVLFAGKMRRTGGSPAITISKQKFNLNSAAGEIFRRTNAKFVHVFWDASAHKVAVRPTLKADSQTYALIMPAEKRNVSFTAQAFLKHIGWNDPEACTVPAEWNAKGKRLEAVLPKRNIGERAQEPKDARRKRRTRR